MVSDSEQLLAMIIKCSHQVERHMSLDTSCWEANKTGWMDLRSDLAGLSAYVLALEKNNVVN